MRSRLVASPGRDCQSWGRNSSIDTVLRRVQETLPLACQKGLFGQFSIILKFENSRAVSARIIHGHQGERSAGGHSDGRQRRSLARIERAIRSAFLALPKAGFFGLLRLNFEHTNGAVYYKDTVHETGFSLD